MTRHLAYYAELRAAMALLATQGVGVFNKQHFVLDKGGKAHKVAGSGTHTAAWELLEEWAGSARAADVLSDILTPAGQPIRDWLAALPQGATWEPIASQWLKQIGLDLELFGSQDHDARNEASYRPNYLHLQPVLPSTDAIRTTRELWRLLEPSPPLTFAELDRHLLRRTLETAFSSVQGKTYRQAPAKFREQVEAAVSMCVGQGEQTLWSEFLCRQLEPDDPEILALAALGPQPSRLDYHVSMMGRALLLLRVASGATRRLLNEAGVPLQSLSFWWKPYGEGLGLWDDPAPDVAQLTDGWADAEAVLQDIEDYLATEEPASYRRVVTALPRPFATLPGLEMVGVWSLAA